MINLPEKTVAVATAEMRDIPRDGVADATIDNRPISTSQRSDRDALTAFGNS